MKPVGFGLLCLSTALLGQPDRARAQAGASPVARMIQDWNERRGAVTTARYRFSGSQQIVDLYMPNVTLPPGPKTHPYEGTIVIECARQRFSIEEACYVPSIPAQRYVLRHSKTMYDGKRYISISDRTKNELAPDDPDVGVASGDLSQKALGFSVWPAFSAHGFTPTVHSPLRPGALPSAYEAEEFEDRGLTRHEGQECRVIKTGSVAAVPPLSDEIWTCPSKKHAVVRHVYYAGKHPACRIDTLFQSVPCGWVPESWTVTTMQNGRVEMITKLSVTQAEYNFEVSDADFSFRPEPGMIIREEHNPARGSGLDPSYPQFRKYKVEANGTETTLESRGMRTPEGVQLPFAGTGTRWRAWAVAGAAAILLLGGVLVAVRIRRASHSDRRQ